MGLVDARASAGAITLPLSSQIPGRVLTFKDIYGAVTNSTIVITTSSPDIFEDGTNYRVLTNPYDFLTVYAGSTGVWYIVGGNQFNWLRTVNQSNTGASYTNILYATNVSTPIVNTTTLYATSNVSTLIVNTSNLTTVYGTLISTFTNNIVGNSINPASTIFIGNTLTPAYSTSRISTISLGNNTNRFFQGFFVSTITSSINADIGSFGNVSTQSLTGFNIIGTTILSTQQIFCSSLQIGPADAVLDVLGPIRAQDVSTLTLEASTITAGTMTLDRLFGGPILSATTTGNLYPFTAGSLVGFGSNIAQGGTYAEGHFRSTFTQVIQPTLDTGQFSNIVYINGFVSSQSINTSTININTIFSQTTATSTLATNYLSSGNAFISTLNINGFTVGNGIGYVNIPFIQSILVSSIQMNTSILNTSTINQKLPPFWSTLNIPNSTFIINGTLAGNPAVPIVLYSNVQFPPYTQGAYKIYQKAILTKNSAGGGTDIHGNIFYTQGTFPSTPALLHDGYSALPFVNNSGFSSFTTLTTFCVISSITTRNICYYDQSAATYTANLYMGRLAVEYIPTLGNAPDFGNFN